MLLFVVIFNDKRRLDQYIIMSVLEIGKLRFSRKILPLTKFSVVYECIYIANLDVRYMQVNHFLKCLFPLVHLLENYLLQI